jgi:predicted dehydrogenase
VDIYAKNFLKHPWAPFDEFRIELEGDEAISSIAISYASNRRNLYIDLLGTDGVLYLDLQSMLLIHHGSKKSVRPLAFARYSSNIAFQLAGEVTINAFKLALGKLRLGHDILIEGFIDSVLNDKPPPVTGEDGRETTKVVEMIVDRLRNKYARKRSP